MRRMTRIKVALVKIRVILNGAYDDFAPKHIPPADRGRHSAHGDQSIHHRGVALTPEPSLHPAHREAQNQVQMIDAKPVNHQLVLHIHLVKIAVMGKLCAEPVRRFRRPACTDTIRDNQKVFLGIKRLARPEQMCGNAGREKIAPGSRGTMKQENSILRVPRLVSFQISQRRVMQLENSQGFTVVKTRVPDGKICLIRLRGFRKARKHRRRDDDKNSRESMENHRVPPGVLPRSKAARVLAGRRATGFAEGCCDCRAGASARKSLMVAREVICSGSVSSSMTAGFPDATARSNAGTNSSVVATFSPCPPKALMYCAKSGLVSEVPETRPGYTRSWCIRIVPYIWLLNTSTMGATPWWNAVASSWPVIRKPPSPTNAMAMRSGRISLAAIAAGMA